MTVINFKKSPKTSEIKMPNNLDIMIRRAGLLNKEVAERKGIRPETVSRHISGALQFTIKDAEEYAMILDCTPQDILFVQNAVPLFGYLDNDVVTTVTPVEKDRAFYVPWPVEQDRRVVISKHSNTNKQWANGRLYMFDSTPINQGIVDPNCFMNLSMFLIQGNTIPQFGVLYPEPGGTFAVGFNTDSHTKMDQSFTTGVTGIPNEIRHHLQLSWGCPIVSCIFRPDLVGVVEKHF